jgi:hypothetical protein
MLRPCVAYGGGPTSIQIKELQKGCDILIATTGRLKDFINRPEILSLERLRYIVFDEADELMDGGWTEDLHAILNASRFKSNVQTMMFSATFSDDAQSAASQYTKTNDCVRIEVGRVGSTHGNIDQVVRWVDENEKKHATFDLLFSLPPARTLIFVNNKRMADELDDFLFNRGFPSTSLHADRNQREREEAVIAFRTGVSPIMVTTSITARGIDVKAVHHVINYDLPIQGGIDEYVHRIGRTGRIGNEELPGLAFQQCRLASLRRFLSRRSTFIMGALHNEISFTSPSIYLSFPLSSTIITIMSDDEYGYLDEILVDPAIFPALLDSNPLTQPEAPQIWTSPIHPTQLPAYLLPLDLARRTHTQKPTIVWKEQDIFDLPEPEEDEEDEEDLLGLPLHGIELHRPPTADKYWTCAEEKWNNRQTTEERKVALSQAGKIMETSLGRRAIDSCVE